MLPTLRDHDGFSYFREWSGGILAGIFEPNCKPVFHRGIPKPFEFQLLADDWNHFRESKLTVWKWHMVNNDILPVL